MSLPPLRASNLLIADRPLLVLPRLVAFVGLNEAIVLQQVRYWLSDDLHPQVRDGRRWVYNSYEGWQERNFPFWSVATVKRTFASLERQGLLLSANYNKSGRDHTKWYTVEFDRLLELDQLYRAAHGQARHHQGRGGRAARTPDTPSLPATDLLLDEAPLLLLPRLATRIGFDEALVLQQVRYWLGDRRAPLVREGRRWVRCPLHRWHEQFPFRSAPTINRVIRNLTESGLLIATATHNQESGDRTLWYTIDFERVAAIGHAGFVADGQLDTVAIQSHGATVDDDRCATTPVDHSEPNHLITMSSQLLHIPAASDHFGLPSEIKMTQPCDQFDPVQGINLARSLKDSEIPTETQTEIQQQHPPVEAPASNVVVADVDDLIEALTARGITRLAAARLAAQYTHTCITQQVEIFDFLRSEAPGDPKLSPGRLRRQIEEDWTPPIGFSSTAERTAQAEAAVLLAHERERIASTAEQQWAAKNSARQAEVDALGLTGADQALWSRVTQMAPPLPSPFRDAFFHAPRVPGEDAAVIFRDRATWARATGAAHSTTRTHVVARVADLCHRPGARVHYLVYDDVLRLLSSSDA